MANARDWRVGVNLIGLTNFISTVIGPNLTSCHVKLILVTLLGSWCIWFIYSDILFKNLTKKKCLLLSEFTTVKHRMCKIWSTWRWTDVLSLSRLRWSTSAGLLLFWAEGHQVSSLVGFHAFLSEVENGIKLFRIWKTFWSIQTKLTKVFAGNWTLVLCERNQSLSSKIF